MPAHEADDFRLAEINAALTGTPFHRQLHHFVTIGSTNTYALEQARAGAAHGCCYVADEQTAGRGRSDHQWHSARAQGLYLSVLLRPEISPSELVWLPLMAGLAAHRAIREVTGLDADLRWPNDILVGPRKTAGILVEAQTEAGRVSAAVIGIGVNIHQQKFPADLATAATSLDLETGMIHDRQQLLIALLQALAQELAVLSPCAARTARLNAIPARIESISTWVRGRAVEVHGPRTCTGITAGLDERGFLQLETAAGLITVTTGGIRDAGPTV